MSEESKDLMDETSEETSNDAAATESPSLDLVVNIESPSACERHVTVTVSRADIDRYFDDAYSELVPTASVPGFRAGRAPRKLVEGRFKQEVTDQVKGTLLMDCLEKISEDKHFAAISEPEIDLDAVDVPETGPMTFEFDIEVRPEFDMPEWKGLSLTRPMREFTDEDVDEQLETMLTRYAQLVPSKEPAKVGDYVTLDIKTSYEGKTVEKEEEVIARVRPVLSFVDCQLEGFDKLMEGAKADDKKSAQVTLTADAANEALAGKTLDVEFQVLEVKTLKLPELNEDFLQELGNFETVDALREAIMQNLQRQLEYSQQQKVREQITATLVESADWELPPGLLKRQSARELERAIMELRRSGFSESDIRARENQLRQNSNASTATALKEHFILERIAEEESIDAEEGDFNQEIFLMAMQSGESPRRVRAQFEKRGLMDVLRNQIVERKVLALVQEQADFKDEPFEQESRDTVEAIQVAAGGPGEIHEVKEAKKEDAEAETAEK